MKYALVSILFFTLLLPSAYAEGSSSNCLMKTMNYLFPPQETKAHKKWIRFENELKELGLEEKLAAEAKTTLAYLKEKNCYNSDLYNMALELNNPEQHELFREVLSKFEPREFNDKEFANDVEFVLKKRNPELAREITEVVRTEGLNHSKIKEKEAEVKLRPHLNPDSVQRMLDWDGFQPRLKAFSTRYMDFNRSKPAYKTIQTISEPGSIWLERYGGHLHIKTDFKPGKIRFRIGSIKADSKFKYGTETKKINPSQAMGFYMRDLLWTAAATTAKDSKINRVEFIAQNVVNDDLKELLKSLGFQLEKNPRTDLYIEDYAISGDFYRLSLSKKDFETMDFSKGVKEVYKHYEYTGANLFKDAELIKNQYQLLAVEFLCSKQLRVTTKLDEIYEIQNFEQLAAFEAKYN